MLKKILLGLVALIVVVVLGVYFWLGAPTSATDATMSAYINAIKLAKSNIDQTIKDDPLMDDDGNYRAEGYRWVTRLVSSVSIGLLHDFDPANPRIGRCVECNKLGFDSPDFTYLGIGPLSHKYTYRLYGKRNTAKMMLFQLLGKGYGSERAVSHHDLTIDDQGNWELYLSAEKPEQTNSWLQITDKDTQLLSRIVFEDWSEIEPSIEIEVVEGPPTTPVFGDSEFTKGATMASGAIVALTKVFINSFHKLGVNEFKVPCENMNCTGVDDEGGFVSTVYGTARYHVPEGQAMIIEVPAIEAEFRDIQVTNAWTESLDYINRQTSLNSATDYLDEDGIYRYVLSHEDPGYNNWLDISNHEYGGLTLRWIFLSGERPPAPQVKVVSFAELSQHMPSTHKFVSAEERKEDLQFRKKYGLRRLNSAGF